MNKLLLSTLILVFSSCTKTPTKPFYITSKVQYKNSVYLCYYGYGFKGAYFTEHFIDSCNKYDVGDTIK